MATTFQIKRSSVTGKVPNTTTLSIGELGLNLTDQKLFSSNGTGVFELGANLTNQTVNTQLTVGNSSVNAQINSSVLSIGTGTYTSSVNVGSNVYLNTSSLFIGNSTINAVVNTNHLVISNSTSTVSANLSGVLINVSSTDAALRVVQRGTGDVLIVEDVENDVTRFSVDQFGRTVIGHTGQMVIPTTSGSQSFSIHANSGSGISPFIGIYGWGTRPALQTFFSNNTTIGDKDTVPNLPASGQVLSDWLNYVHTDANSSILSGYIRLSVDGTPNTTTVPTAFSFYQQNATSTTAAIRHFWAANGNYGVGTTSPTQTLHVSGNSLVTGTMLVGSNVTVNTSALFIGNTTQNVIVDQNSISFGTQTLISNTTGTLINISSTGTALRVVQRSNGDAFRVDDADGDTTPFLIDTLGRVIQGHTAGVLTGANYYHQLHGNGTSTAGKNIFGWNAVPSINFTYSTNPEVANGTAPTTLPTGNYVFPLRVRTHTDTDTYTESLRFTVSVDGTPNTTTIPTAFSIQQQNATSTTIGTRHFWAANGNYGVGTNSPTERLHVSGNSLVTGTMLVGSNVTVNTSALFIGNATVNSITNSSSRPWTLIGKTTVSSPVTSISQSVTFTDWSYVVAIFNSLSTDNSGGSTVWISLANSSANIVTATANLAATDARSTSGRAEILSRARGHFIELQGVTEPSTDVANTIGYSGSIQPVTAVSVSAQTATRILCGFTAGNVDAGSISFYGIRD